MPSEREPDVPALKGWRRELFGEDALRLKRGELALMVRKGEVVVQPVVAPARAEILTRPRKLWV